MTGATASAGQKSFVHLFLIRGFELRHGDEVVPVPPCSQRLVAFVALHDRAKECRELMTCSVSFRCSAMISCLTGMRTGCSSSASASASCACTRSSGSQRASPTPGCTAQALQAGLAAVAAEPLRESSRRQLVRTHIREGNISEALREYQAYARMLAEELGVAPTAAMNELIRGAVPNAC